MRACEFARGRVGVSVKVNTNVNAGVLVSFVSWSPSSSTDPPAPHPDGGDLVEGFVEVLPSVGPLGVAGN